jgi:hypothetical protein
MKPLPSASLLSSWLHVGSNHRPEKTYGSCRSKIVRSDRDWPKLAKRPRFLSLLMSLPIRNPPLDRRCHVDKTLTFDRAHWDPSRAGQKCRKRSKKHIHRGAGRTSSTVSARLRFDQKSSRKLLPSPSRNATMKPNLKNQITPSLAPRPSILFGALEWPDLVRKNSLSVNWKSCRYFGSMAR